MLRLLTLFFACAFVATLSTAQAASNLAGTWSGMLSFPNGQSLLFVMAISDDGGKLSATAHSPYQGQDPMTVDAIDSNGGYVTFNIKKVDAAFHGTMSGSTISGTFVQHGVSVPLVLQSSSVGTSMLDGTWVGTLKPPGGTLLLGLHIKRGADGALSATLDSPYQGGFGLPVKTIANSGGTLTFAMPDLGATFKGTLSSDAIAGTFTQKGTSFPLTFARP